MPRGGEGPITEREYEILKHHWAGRKHSWICKEYEISRPELTELIRRTAKGYEVVPRPEPFWKQGYIVKK